MIQIYFVPRNTDHLVSIANNELAKVVTWLKVLTKTNFVISPPGQKKINVNVRLVMENTIIKQVVETKFLFLLFSTFP